MIGDKLLIKPEHKIIADKIVAKIQSKVLECKKDNKKYVISVAGESGSGKSEMGHEIKRALLESDIKADVFGQDSYFVYPPKTNHTMRTKNIDQVGLYEVKLDLMDANLFAFKSHNKEIYKPTVDYNADKIIHEVREVASLDVLIVEGTFTTSLEYVDTRVFIDRTYKHTKADREERGREKFDPFIEQVLEIEHKEISSHKAKADLIIAPDFSDIS